MIMWGKNILEERIGTHGSTLGVSKEWQGDQCRWGMRSLVKLVTYNTSDVTG